MGTYVGSATLLDEGDGTVVDVRVALSTADPFGEKWFASVEGLADVGADFDGRDVLVSLPAGTKARARVVVDITGDEPVIRLVGTSRSPV
jgi:hypothetical protein